MRRALAIAGRALDFGIAACLGCAALVLVALVVCVGLEVVLRYFFDAPTKWVTEFSEYALLWLAFFAGAWVLREEGHVKVEMVIEELPRRSQHVLHVVTSLVGAAVCALFSWVSASYVLEVYNSGELLFKAIVLPKWTVMVIMPPGLALLALQFLRRAFRPPPAPGQSAF
jgi:TRAP-type C4-dicarboxylate transport system permease small subunit